MGAHLPYLCPPLPPLPAGKKADEKTIEHMIETGESESMFQKAIQDVGRGQVRSRDYVIIITSLLVPLRG